MSPPREPPDLGRIVAAEFPDEPRAARLVAAFLDARRFYRRELVADLLALAGPGSGQSWEVRLLAALMLQHQFLCLPAGEQDEALAFLARLGLFELGASRPRIREAVLREGYTTTEPVAFLREFRRHLGRLGPVLSPLRRRRIAPRALRDFLAVARDECRLALARYLFHPDEVAERVRAQVRRSSGEPIPTKHPAIALEARRATDRLPSYEAGLIRALSRGSEAYWAAEQTAARLNALVEQPLQTVVLTVKPPGSSLEIEIKRAGRRAGRPLGIAYERDGRPVPSSHRLDGGSAADALEFEARAVALLARIYRRVHRSEPPIAIPVALASLNTLPVGASGSVHLIDYFTDPEVFGPDYAPMRHALHQSVEAFAREGRTVLEGLEGAWGETLQFLHQMIPAQMILVGTSSFRLDALARYLAADGPRRYFEEGLHARPSRGEARRFADTLLGEILGTYRPPRISYRTHAAYLEAAYAHPPNRARADRVHAALLRQLGTFWGTMLAVRGFSYGESFVARNVGLKSAWDRGRWRVRLIFMDHDNLHLPSRSGGAFDPPRFLAGARKDESHVTGHPGKRQALSCAVDYLQFLYRIDDRTAADHRAILRRSMTRAYRQAQRKMATRPGLARLFPDGFIAHSQAWDRAVATYLRRRDEAGPGPSWADEADALLQEQGLSPDLRRRYIRAIENHAPFLERSSFLYLPGPAPPGPAPGK